MDVGTIFTLLIGWVVVGAFVALRAGKYIADNRGWRA